MGVLTNFTAAKYETIAPGFQRTSLTGGGGTEMTAYLYRISPAAAFSFSVPDSADQYLFALSGSLSLRTSTEERITVPENAFALCAGGMRLEIAGSGKGECLVVSVIAPPNGKSSRAGFNGTVKVLAVSEQPVVDIPDQKKKRIYLATKQTAATERAHGMIVVYEHDTVTANHLHPNAESLFVFLEGKAVVTVNNEEVTVGRGQSTFYGMNDKHRLRSAGAEVRFLEFHIPGGYTTIKD